MRKVLRKLPVPGASPPRRDPPPPEPPAPDLTGVVPEPPVHKKLVSLRLDADVIAFFQSDGKGYQTRINAVLRGYMNARRKAP
jgi:hypothetical protein